jgi:5-methyltetrahydropteroyltriglutamate--homocysteine methyltransferase
VVHRQTEVGIDVPGDGEFGKSVGNRVNYGAWWNYAFQRLGGLELGGPGLDHMTPRCARPGEIALTNAARRRDRVRFAAMATRSRASSWGHGQTRGRSVSVR